MTYLFLVGCFLAFCQLQSLHAAPGTDDPPAPKSTNVTITRLTADQDKALNTFGRLSVVPESNGIYVPGPIRFPCGETWTSWWARNYWYFQCLANRYCRPYRGCWCNQCACYLFIVYPQSPPCGIWTHWIYASAIQVDGYIN